MSTRELIRIEIDKVPDEALDELYGLIKLLTAAKPAKQPGIMEKLRAIRIDAPPDFASNLDQYMSGEKRVGTDVS